VSAAAHRSIAGVRIGDGAGESPPGGRVSSRDLRGEAVGGVMARRLGVARKVGGGWAETTTRGALQGGSFG